MSDNQDLACLSAGYVDELLEAFQRDPESVSPSWRRYFESELNGHSENRANGHAEPAANGRHVALVESPPAEEYVEEADDEETEDEEPPTVATAAEPRAAAEAIVAESSQPLPVDRAQQAFPENLRSMRIARLQDRVDQLVRAFRVRGHLAAQLDPLGFERPDQPELDPGYYGFGPEDLDIPFSTTGIGGPPTQTLRQIVSRLRNTYCGAIGSQFMHIGDIAIRQWLALRMESSENRLPLSRDQQVQILTRLTDAVIFEKFVRKKFVGAKTFSLEGAETLIPLLHLALEKAGSQGVEEVVLAMAHRGRLNVLVNVVGKSPRELFVEFADPHPGLNLGRGDVKSNLG